jgi:lysyl-tRNA synthetase class 2
MPRQDPATRSHTAFWRPGVSRDVLVRRRQLIDVVRQFFRDREVLEVDTPVLQGGANLDRGVIPFTVATGDRPRFLPTSPEHPLKRLVAAGHGPVWTLAPAFRLGERGRRHAPEFRMLEWYRPGWDDHRLADEVIALLSVLTGFNSSSEQVTWRSAFRRHAGFDPFLADDRTIAEAVGPDIEAVMSGDSLDREAALDLILTNRVEPHLGRGCWTVMGDYPAEACAQARLRPGEDGHLVAARFEIYRDGLELANGYWELTNAVELQARQQRELAGRSHGEVLDQRFLEAVAQGLPDCAGVAVGFDRVVMLALGVDDIASVQPFSWERA